MPNGTRSRDTAATFRAEPKKIKETAMSDADNSRFVMRDRHWHPKGLTPDYKTSITRSPRQALVSIPQSISEATGPDFSHLQFGKHDADLLLNFNTGSLPVGERIILSGRVLDQYGK